jgi:cell division protein ZapE
MIIWEIAAQFHTVLLSNIPQMSAGQASKHVDSPGSSTCCTTIRSNCWRRLRLRRGKLYTAARWPGEFARTASRLLEMQSREYLESPRRSVASV